MRHLALSVALALSPAFLLVAPASAQTTAGAAQPGLGAPDPAPPAGTQTTIEGRALGEHVSGHAPEHPRQMGRLFGECVSELALTGTCPHEDMDGQ
jgi:hypothetical protein